MQATDITLWFSICLQRQNPHVPERRKARDRSQAHLGVGATIISTRSQPSQITQMLEEVEASHTDSFRFQLWHLNKINVLQYAKKCQWWNREQLQGIYFTSTVVTNHCYQSSYSNVVDQIEFVLVKDRTLNFRYNAKNQLQLA